TNSYKLYEYISEYLRNSTSVCATK
ncbi:hypothetical protein A5886_001598, partial [Enterococcus sp. 8G7_MSG3316]